MAVVHGDEEQVIRGNAAICLPQLPYQGLSAFGASFLNSFQALVLNSDILKDITFVDTPGVLSGSKQRYGRAYDFATIVPWMAERADLVLLTFDANKLDISDEFQQVLQKLLPHADKVRCVLNKADEIDAANLVRVNGALLWNLGKVFKTPEVARVFVSSFWDEPYRFQDLAQLFDEDKEALLKDLYSLPRTSLLAKLNSFVARVRRLRAHMCVMVHLHSRLPWRFRLLRREAGARRWLLSHLPRLLEEARLTRGVIVGDMPKVEAFRERLASFEGVLELPSWDQREMERLTRIVNVDVPQLINQCQVGGVTMAPMSTQELPSPPQGLLSRCSAATKRLLGRLGLGGGASRRRTSAQLS